MSRITFENRDCMEAMKDFPDQFFDLAIVDPPYGDASGGNPNRFGERFDRYKKIERRGCGHNKYKKQAIEWDVAPSEDYFKELFRVSKNQIIWGGELFSITADPLFCSST